MDSRRKKIDSRFELPSHVLEAFENATTIPTSQRYEDDEDSAEDVENEGSGEEKPSDE